MFFCILFNYTILRDTKVRWAAAPTMSLTSLGPLIVYFRKVIAREDGFGSCMRMRSLSRQRLDQIID
jgi:hypothetical protein